MSSTPSPNRLPSWYLSSLDSRYLRSKGADAAARFQHAEIETALAILLGGAVVLTEAQAFDSRAMFVVKNALEARARVFSKSRTAPMATHPFRIGIRRTMYRHNDYIDAVAKLIGGPELGGPETFELSAWPEIDREPKQRQELAKLLLRRDYPTAISRFPKLEPRIEAVQLLNRYFNRPLSARWRVTDPKSAPLKTEDFMAWAGELDEVKLESLETQADRSGRHLFDGHDRTVVLQFAQVVKNCAKTVKDIANRSQWQNVIRDRPANEKEALNSYLDMSYNLANAGSLRVNNPVVTANSPQAAHGATVRVSERLHAVAEWDLNGRAIPPVGIPWYGPFTLAIHANTKLVSEVSPVNWEAVWEAVRSAQWGKSVQRLWQALSKREENAPVHDALWQHIQVLDGALSRNDFAKFDFVAKTRKLIVSRPVRDLVGVVLVLAFIDHVGLRPDINLLGGVVDDALEVAGTTAGVVATDTGLNWLNVGRNRLAVYDSISIVSGT